MKLPLTKALRIRTALDEKLKTFDLKTSVQLDLDSEKVQHNPTEIVVAASSALVERMKVFERLSLILKGLRTEVAKANATSGVEETLAEQGHVDRQLAKIKQVLAQPRVELDTIANKITRKREALNNASTTVTRGYGMSEASDSISFNAVTSEQVSALETQQAALRRLKADLEDRRNLLNARTDIEIGDDDYALLIEQAVI